MCVHDTLNKADGEVTCISVGLRVEHFRHQRDHQKRKISSRLRIRSKLDWRIENKIKEFRVFEYLSLLASLSLSLTLALTLYPRGTSPEGDTVDGPMDAALAEELTARQNKV